MFFESDVICTIALLIFQLSVWPRKKRIDWPPPIEVKRIPLPRPLKKSLSANVLIKQSVAQHNNTHMDEIGPETELGYKYSTIVSDLKQKVGKSLEADEHTTVGELIRQATKEG